MDSTTVAASARERAVATRLGVSRRRKSGAAPLASPAPSRASTMRLDGRTVAAGSMKSSSAAQKTHGVRKAPSGEWAPASYSSAPMTAPNAHALPVMTSIVANALPRSSPQPLIEMEVRHDVSTSVEPTPPNPRTRRNATSKPGPGASGSRPNMKTLSEARQTPISAVVRSPTQLISSGDSGAASAVASGYAENTAPTPFGPSARPGGEAGK
eukprot:scaffold9034_cov124-Isochrysis_galbana.AAC.7